jgi:hypothetical protein
MKGNGRILGHFLQFFERLHLFVFSSCQDASRLRLVSLLDLVFDGWRYEWHSWKNNWELSRRSWHRIRQN